MMVVVFSWLTGLPCLNKGVSVYLSTDELARADMVWLDVCYI